jgi:hypothetical protein
MHGPGSLQPFSANALLWHIPPEIGAIVARLNRLWLDNGGQSLAMSR